MNKLLRTTNFLTLTFFVCFLQAQNTEWQTDLAKGLMIAKEENKNVLVEFGLNQDGIPLYITDKVWTDEAILAKLPSFIPVSIDLNQDTTDLTSTYNLVFAPSLFLLSPEGDVIYQTSGMKMVFELDDLLQAFQSQLLKIQKIKSIYSEDDVLGNMLLIDEYFKLLTSSPSHMEDDLLGFIAEKIILLDMKTSTFDPVQDQRFKIFKYLYNLIKYSDESRQRKLYKLGEKNLYSTNHSLLLFAVGTGEMIIGDDETAKSISAELEKRIGKDQQAAEYSSILKKGLDL